MTLDDGPQPTAEQTVSTPGIRSVARRSLFWVGAFVFVLIIAAVSFSTAGSGADGTRLAGDSPSPAGAKAVVEVLRDRGVTVQLAESLDEARAAASDTATVFFYDEHGLLSDEQLSEIGGLGAHLVVAAADFDTLQLLAPQVAMAGAITDSAPVPADCALGFAPRVDAITGEGRGYRITDTAAQEVTGCFPSPDDVYSLVQVTGGGHTTTIIGSTAIFANETIVDAGNAALALNLLGASDRLIWYLPSLADLPVGEPTLAELSPEWLPAATGLLAFVLIAAALWRGRRFGPLVVEKLPVVVPGSETMEGRARLYQRATARGHAIDAIRIGTIGRLAGQLGLSRLSNVDEVVNAVAARIGAPVGEIQHILVTALPKTDAELMALSDALLTIEQRVAVTVVGRGARAAGPHAAQPDAAQLHRAQSHDAQFKDALSSTVDPSVLARNTVDPNKSPPGGERPANGTEQGE